MNDPGKVTDSRATVFASLVGELRAAYENEPLLMVENGIRCRAIREKWIRQMLAFAGYTFPEAPK